MATLNLRISLDMYLPEFYPKMRTFIWHLSRLD